MTPAAGKNQGEDRSSAEERDRRLRWYPTAWRDRYGDELLALLDDEYEGRLPAEVRVGLVTGGLVQRARQSGIAGDAVPAPEGMRAGALTVLAAWMIFVIAGASFAKFAEHFDQALPHQMSAHRVPDVAFSVVQVSAGVAALCVALGTVLALPAFVRFLRAGGWASVRAHVRRALASTVFTVGATVPLLAWAHHLTPHQRNGGLAAYGVVVLVWAVLIVVTLALWTVVAVAAARRVDLCRPVLTAEAVLGLAVAGSMAVMVGAVAVWWGAMAIKAPEFLSAMPRGAPSSPWDVWLIGTVALMLIAVGIAAAGVVREVRMWARMRAA
ncbi:MAG TPA: hypothetical protein VHD39_05520 [Acidimicrobiales bacterium]|nr:hypothetical protein [Acidimicrobiales bacterium]